MQYNFENLEEVEITDPAMASFLSQEKFTICFDKGAWIAGGFARLLAHHVLTLSTGDVTLLESVYSLMTPPVGYIPYRFKEYFEQGGDIDFFFSNTQQPKAAYEALTSPVIDGQSPPIGIGGGYRGNGPFAKNVMLDDNIKMQLVEKFIYADIKQTFESFDFMNSCYAIRSKDSRFYLVYHPKARLFDRKKQLCINNANSPYTLGRMRKYLLHRGIDSISSESREVFLEILIRGACLTYDKKYNLYGSPLIYSGVKFLYGKGLISVENVALFLGKFKIAADNYGQSYDWALREIEQSARDTNDVYNKNLNEVSNAT